MGPQGTSNGCDFNVVSKKTGGIEDVKPIGEMLIQPRQDKVLDTSPV
jgi:hypothetical protein